MRISILKIVLFIFLLGTVINADDGSKDKNNKINKSLIQISRTYLDINNISTQFYNDGIGDIDPNGNAGLVYPKGSGKTACYTSGLLFGGMVQGDAIPRVGGTAYRTGLQPGAILANGQADDPSLDKYRIYRVRPDVKPGGPTADLSAEALNENTTASVLQQQYEKDWTEWPASLGAPYTDVNNNGVFDPTVDIPGVNGANMTIWFVANDMNAAKTANLYGSQPMGIELQTTYWAYSQTGVMGQMFFRKYKLINKGYQNNTINDTYLSMWARC
jgi:hypothetical protein